MDLMGTLGKLAGGNAGMAEQAMAMVNDAGGLEGVVSKFKDAGFGDQVQSWLGDGDNMSITGQAVEKVFGLPMVSSFASKLGVEPGEFASQIATFLPQAVSALSSGGSWTDMASGLVGKAAAGNAMDSIKKLF